MAKVKCSVSHIQFQEAAQAGKVRIVGNNGAVMVGQNQMAVQVKDVDPAKSLGLFSHGKALVEVELADGTKRICEAQVGTNITLIGSKPE